MSGIKYISIIAADIFYLLKINFLKELIKKKAYPQMDMPSAPNLKNVKYFY